MTENEIYHEFGYPNLHPDTKVYRVIGQGFPSLPSGEGMTGFWTTNLEEANRLCQAHEDACFSAGLPCHTVVIQGVARDFTPSPKDHARNEVFYNEYFDRHEVYLVYNEEQHD